MGQQEQEFSSEAQGKDKRALDNEEIYAQQPYYWSTRSTRGDEPKDEHPSTFEGSIPPYSYQAQEHESAQQSERVVDAESPAREQSQQRSQRQYQAYWQVPSWARPQQHQGNKVLRWIVLIILAVVLIKPIIVLVTIIVGAIGLAVGVALLAILLPIFILLAILLAFVAMALIFLAMLGVPIRRGRFRMRSRSWR